MLKILLSARNFYNSLALIGLFFISLITPKLSTAQINFTDNAESGTITTKWTMSNSGDYTYSNASNHVIDGTKSVDQVTGSGPATDYIYTNLGSSINLNAATVTWKVNLAYFVKGPTGSANYYLYYLVSDNSALGGGSEHGYAVGIDNVDASNFDLNLFKVNGATVSKILTIASTGSCPFATGCAGNNATDNVGVVISRSTAGVWSCQYTTTAVNFTGLSSAVTVTDNTYSSFTNCYSGLYFFYNASGGGFGFDDVSIVQTLPTPTISTSGSISAVSTTYGTASANSATTFTVSGTGLGTNNLVVTAPTGFEISTSSGSGFATSLSFTPSSGSVTTQTIYIRLAATTTPGTYSGNVACTSSGATTVNVATASSMVNTKALTVTSAAASNKVYDRTNAATITGTLSGIVGSDAVTLSGTGTFASVNVANGIAITSTSTLGGAQASYYTLTQPTGLTANITAKALTISGISINNKTYDRTNSATISGTASLVGIISPDAVTVSGGSATFTSVNVGTGIGTTVSGYVLGGTNAGNYSLTQPSGLTANINAVTLTESGASASSKVYDRTNTATVSGGTLTGVLSPDAVSVSTAGTFASVNVANGIVVTLALTGAQAGNYTLTQPGITANITPTPLTVTGLTYNNKVYDRTNAATLGGTATLSGVISPDAVTLGGTATATFASTNVANGIGVSVTGYTISGAQSGNYSLTQPSGTANITAKALTISGISINNKTYDRTNSATISGTASLVGIISPDAVTVSGGSATFASVNVGTGIGTTVSGYALGGTNAGNYSLTQPSGLTANITAITLTESGASASNKPYDGTTTATVSGGTLSGVISPDAVSISTTGTFASANAANGIVVTLALTGAQAGNYTLTQPGITANITQIGQTITFGPLIDQLQSVGSITLTATASSGLTVTYTSSNTSVATVSGNTLTFVGSGYTYITASQAGNTNYAAAVPVKQVQWVYPGGSGPAAGDIIFTQASGDADGFEFMTLKVLNLAGTNYTDEGICTNGRIETGTEHIYATNVASLSTAVPAGTFIRISLGNPGTNKNTTFDGWTQYFTGDGSGLNNSGESMVCYTGSLLDCSAGSGTNTYISGINWGNSGWVSSSSPGTDQCKAPGTPTDFAASSNSNVKFNGTVTGNAANLILTTGTGMRNPSNWASYSAGSDFSTDATLKSILFDETNYSSGSIVFSDVTTTGMTIDWSGITWSTTPTISTRYLVAVYTTSSIDNAVDRYTCYNWNSNYTTAPAVVKAISGQTATNMCGTTTTGNGSVVYFGYGTSVSINGLLTGNTYYVKVFAVNGNGYTANFSSTAATGNQAISNTITTQAVSGSPFCAGTSNIAVPFYYSTASNFSGATFTAQLSDASRSFSSPTNLQTVAYDGSGFQTIYVTIPSTAATGSGYRIRVVSNSPAILGSDNGTDIQINALPTSVVSGTAAVCNGSTTTVTVTLTGAQPWALTYFDGTTSTPVTGITASPYTFAAPSTAKTYTVTALSDAHCTAQAGDMTGSAVITVNARPTSVVSGTAAVCNGSTTTVTVTLTGAQPWALTYFDGTTSTPVTGITASPYTFAAPSTAKTYTVTALSDAHCTAQAGDMTGSAVVSVNALPQGSLTANGPFCSSGAGQLTWTATAGTGPFTVIYNDGTANRTQSSVTSGTPFNTFTTPVISSTSYTLISVQDAHCTRSSSFTGNSASITIVAQPTAQSIIPSPATTTLVCQGTNISATFSGGSGGITGQYTDTYEYSNDGGTTWSTYTAGNTISTSGISGGSIIQVRTRRIESGSGCGNSSYSYAYWTVIDASTTQWMGNISTDWNNSGNWCPAIPDSTTNVIIPSTTNYQPVITGQAYVKDLNIQRNATVTILNNGHLFMYGSPTIIGNFLHTGGVLELAGGNVQVLPTLTADSVIVKKRTYTRLAANLTILKSLKLTQGVISTGPNLVDVYDTLVTAVDTGTSQSWVFGTLRRAVGDTGIYNLPVGDSLHLQYANINLLVNSPKALGGIDSIIGFFNLMSANTGCTTVPDGSGGPYINGTAINGLLNGGFWTIHPDTSTYTGVSYNVTVKERGYTNAPSDPHELGVIKRANCSQSWQSLGTHANSTQSINTTTGTVTAARTLLSSFSDFGIGFDGSQALPVTMLYINATPIDNSYIQLQWATALEINNYGFEIERSTDAQTWAAVSFVTGHNNATSENDYTYNDKDVTGNVRYYYRLKQTDNNGHYTYTDIVTGMITNNNAYTTDVEVYPNPASGKVKLSINSALDQEVIVEIYNLMGQKVLFNRYEILKSDIIPKELSITMLPPGTYSVIVSTPNSVTAKKLIIAR